MPFALSPGVTIVEKDFSSIIPAVSTSAGAFAGVFSWGPVAEPTTVSSEDVLVQSFGGPNESHTDSSSLEGEVEGPAEETIQTPPYEGRQHEWEETIPKNANGLEQRDPCF